jgi:hypothetical protein
MTTTERKTTANIDFAAGREIHHCAKPETFASNIFTALHIKQTDS